MEKEFIYKICDDLIDHLTVLKGSIQLEKMNNKVDQSIRILQEVANIEKTINELVQKLIESNNS